MDKENKIVNDARTYTEDMTQALQGDKGGLIRKIIEEEERHEEKNKYIYLNSKKNRIFMVLGIFLLFISVAIFVFFIFLKKEDNLVTIAQQYSSVIFTDKTDFVAIDGLTKEKIEDLVYQKILNTTIKEGNIESFYLTENKEVIGLKRLSTLLKSNFSIEGNTVIKDNFMIGVMNNSVDVITGKEMKDFFAIFGVSSSSEAFPMFRTWEKKMLYDFYGFLGLPITPETNYLFTKDFEDGIVNNKNARILKNNEGSVELMYVYIDDTYIVVTKSEEVVKEVMARFASSRIKK